MKKWILTMIVLACICGCVPTADQLKTVGDDVGKLSVLIDDVQKAVTESQLVDERKMAEFNAKIDRIQPEVEEMAEAIKNAPYTDDDLQNIIIGAMEGVKAGQDYIPHSELILGILGLAGITVQTFRKKKSDTALAETVKGINGLKGSESYDIAKDSLKEAQSAETKKLVAILKANL